MTDCSIVAVLLDRGAPDEMLEHLDSDGSCVMHFSDPLTPGEKQERGREEEKLLVTSQGGPGLRGKPVDGGRLRVLCKSRQVLFTISL